MLGLGLQSTQTVCEQLKSEFDSNTVNTELERSINIYESNSSSHLLDLIA